MANDDEYDEVENINKELELTIKAKFLTAVAYFQGPLTILIIISLIEFFIPLPAIQIQVGEAIYPVLSSRVIQAVAAAFLVVRAARYLTNDWSEVMRETLLVEPDQIMISEEVNKNDEKVMGKTQNKSGSEKTQSNDPTGTVQSGELKEVE